MNSTDAFLGLLRGAVHELDNEDPILDPELTDLVSNNLPSNEFKAAAQVLAQASRRMRDNYPYASPLYAGQMLKPPHVVARAAYSMAMAVNPNNHALDGGRASSAMEIEAVSALAAMFGLQQDGRAILGHLTSGGTFANLEALWVAGQTTARKVVVASSEAHYTHQRISAVLDLPFASIKADNNGSMCLNRLEERLSRGDVGTVVATLGTTATGALDPLAGIAQLREKYGFRLHVDAAYGGYFKLAANLSSEARAAFQAISKADSLVVDPHKHGLQPYGCGCVLFADRAVSRLYKHDSPYTYFSSEALHLGEITLECSRAGASAVALWSTQKLFPLVADGAFARGLERCHDAALQLYSLLQSSGNFVMPSSMPQLDIVVWACSGSGVQESSSRARQVFERAAELGLHLALADLRVSFFPEGTWATGDTVTCLRSVLMKWEHLDWVGRIHSRIMEAAASSAAI